MLTGYQTNSRTTLGSQEKRFYKHQKLVKGVNFAKVLFEVHFRSTSVDVLLKVLK